MMFLSKTHIRGVEQLCVIYLSSDNAVKSVSIRTDYVFNLNLVIYRIVTKENHLLCIYR